MPKQLNNTGKITLCNLGNRASPVLMVVSVIRLIQKQIQVIRPVICFYFVDMMNGFPISQKTANDLFNNDNVLTNISSTVRSWMVRNSDMDVSINQDFSPLPIRMAFSFWSIRKESCSIISPKFFESFRSSFAVFLRPKWERFSFAKHIATFLGAENILLISIRSLYLRLDSLNFPFALFAQYYHA
jgi:hypothetical protein